MRFLAKRTDSAILAAGMVYKAKGDNTRLRDMLLAEQHGFCAYTEKRVDKGFDAVDVEHLDPARKNTPADDYYNYYAALHAWNQRKRRREQQYAGADFFTSRFFQDHEELARRIRYVAEDHVFEETDPEDTEAVGLIDYLGYNDPLLVRHRRDHVERLREHFDDLEWTLPQQLEYLARYPDEVSFITALAAVLGVTAEQLLELCPPEPVPGT